MGLGSFGLHREINLKDSADFTNKEKPIKLSTCSFGGQQKLQNSSVCTEVDHIIQTANTRIKNFKETLDNKVNEPHETQISSEMSPRDRAVLKSNVNQES
jgi:hypothetical protein